LKPETHKSKPSEIEIELVKGDITQVPADGIVNAANNHLWMGAGVAGAIRRRGGEEVEREAVARGPIEIGQVVETSAGKLPHKYVLHATVMGQDLVTNANYIRAATQNTLALAEKLGLRSVVMPAFGTGVGRFPLDQCARIMIQEVNRFSEARCLQKVIFALFDDPTMSAFEKERQRQWAQKPK
jgi:O-acetyl-ADP-ribose deacetylase (regulator of RNase III)